MLDLKKKSILNFKISFHPAEGTTKDKKRTDVDYEVKLGNIFSIRIHVLQ